MKFRPVVKFIKSFIFNFLLALVVAHVIIISFLVIEWDLGKLPELYTAERSPAVFRILFIVTLLFSFTGRIKLTIV